jgi:hypothetical protein
MPGVKTQPGGVEGAWPAWPCASTDAGNDAASAVAMAASPAVRHARASVDGV